MSYKRVNKPLARKLFNNGITIKLLPCKVSESVLTGVPHNYDWICPIEISLLDSKETSNNFDNLVNNYEYYNCNKELGNYSHYYVSEEDLDKYSMCQLMCN